MEEYKMGEFKIDENKETTVNTAEPMNGGAYETINGGVELGTAQELPTKISKWTKIKNFLFQEVTLDLTPKQEKVFKEVHDFWHQDVTWKSFKEFWLQDIEITL